jgi:hypothetical protein
MPPVNVEAAESVYIVGDSDYVVFLEDDRGSRIHMCKKQFPLFWPCYTFQRQSHRQESI